MEFDFSLIPILPLPITLVPAATFIALEQNQTQIQQAYASSVSIGLSKGSTGGPIGTSLTSQSLSGHSPGGLVAAVQTLSDQERLGAIVDALGQASAKAQELPTSITQTLRLAKNPTQRVYILRTALDSAEEQWLSQPEIRAPLLNASTQKSVSNLIGSKTYISDADATAINPGSEPKQDMLGGGEKRRVYVAGMLKIGEKKLFIVDKVGTMHEQEVCCVLDFYVDKSCQRQGFGKLLFEYMLKVEKIEPNQIAYDRPSPKLYGFLKKYFELERYLPQPNQFAIFEGFKLVDCGEVIQVDADDHLGRSDSPFIPNLSGSSTEGSVGTGLQKVSVSLPWEQEREQMRLRLEGGHHS
ncbi:Alpha-tubulin N-acetyltransferase 1 [Dissophora globulifera]|uniref:Alpha-tubulin N-acetyltransferase n=1 Tax=Dissophora globulifera TaxID=979702 RepID=A0A9P6UT26_9FUNG|nr:Alpha-tubulin N-acetyltransferase 1 [Dissophora globulifera]